MTTSERGRAFKILECLKRHRGTAGGADLNVSLEGRPDDYIAMGFGPNVTREAGVLEQLAVDLIGQLTEDGGGADLRLVIGSCRFPSGTALVEAARELEEPLKPDEVRQ